MNMNRSENLGKATAAVLCACPWYSIEVDVNKWVKGGDARAQSRVVTIQFCRCRGR